MHVTTEKVFKNEKKNATISVNFKIYLKVKLD